MIDYISIIFIQLFVILEVLFSPSLLLLIQQLITTSFTAISFTSLPLPLPNFSLYDPATLNSILPHTKLLLTSKSSNIIFSPLPQKLFLQYSLFTITWPIFYFRNEFECHLLSKALSGTLPPFHVSICKFLFSESSEYYF